MHAILKRIEAWLYSRGLEQLEVRRLVAVQFAVAGVSSVALIAGSLGRPWSVHYAIMALVVSVNFYHLARFVQAAMQEAKQLRKGAVVASLLRFYGRLIITGLVLFGLIAYAGAGAAPLAAAAGTVVVSAIIWAVGAHHGHNAKEA
jgi:hypothetical protein